MKDNNVGNDNNNKYFVRKVINSKFKEGINYNLVLETFLNQDILTINIEKGDEVLWSKNHIDISYTIEEKPFRKAKLLKLGDDKFREMFEV
jgi:hypothetical protein